MGRFDIRYELASIHEGLGGYQQEVGTYVLWYVFSVEGSERNEGEKGDNVYDDVYDEGTATDPLDWEDPIRIPVLSAVRYEGPEQTSDTGFYTTDRIHLSIDLEQMRAAGFPDVELETRARLHDRIVYDNVVFGVIDIQVRGQLEDSDVVIGVDAAQVNKEELVNEPDFANWSA